MQDLKLKTPILTVIEKMLTILSKIYNFVISVCSIRHDSYGGCRDSAEGGTLLSCLSYMERLSVCIYRIYEKRSSLSKNLRIWCFLPMF